MLGHPGDYLAVRSDDLHDIYIVAEDIFHISYEAFDEVDKHECEHK
jgi:phosphoglycolate phosphatase